jgi:hypothetical protein
MDKHEVIRMRSILIVYFATIALAVLFVSGCVVPSPPGIGQETNYNFEYLYVKYPSAYKIYTINGSGYLSIEVETSSGSNINNVKYDIYNVDTRNTYGSGNLSYDSSDSSYKGEWYRQSAPDGTYRLRLYGYSNDNDYLASNIVTFGINKLKFHFQIVAHNMKDLGIDNCSDKSADYSNKVDFLNDIIDYNDSNRIISPIAMQEYEQSDYGTNSCLGKGIRGTKYFVSHYNSDSSQCPDCKSYLKDFGLALSIIDWIKPDSSSDPPTIELGISFKPEERLPLFHTQHAYACKADGGATVYSETRYAQRGWLYFGDYRILVYNMHLQPISASKTECISYRNWQFWTAMHKFEEELSSADTKTLGGVFMGDSNFHLTGENGDPTDEDYGYFNYSEIDDMVSKLIDAGYSNARKGTTFGAPIIGDGTITVLFNGMLIIGAAYSPPNNISDGFRAPACGYKSSYIKDNKLCIFPTDSNYSDHSSLMVDLKHEEY